MKPPEEFRDDVELAAATVYRRYYKYTTLEDTTQEVWAWLASVWSEVPTMGINDLKKRMRNAAERHCRKEKAAAAGYHPDDEYHYSINRLKQLIHDAYDSEAVPPQESYRDDEQYAEWVTQVADIRRAVLKIPLGHYLTLGEYVHKGRAFDVDVRSAFAALQRQLGGSKPR